jgi:hypothetical protein
MAWVKLDDQFPDHPKVVAAGPAAGWLYVCGLAYCSRYLTDGFIPKDQIRRLADVGSTQKHAEALVAVGLWERTEGGYLVHDYLEYNPSKERVLATRDARAVAGSYGGKQKASNLLDASNGAATNNDTTLRKQNSTPSRTPTPSRNDNDVLASSGDKITGPNGPGGDSPPETQKPRTQKQIESDRLYERRTALYAAYCSGVGIKPDSLAWRQAEQRSFRELKPVINEPELTPEAMESLSLYTAKAYQWRKGRATPTVAEVLAASAEWESLGRPVEPPAAKVNGRGPTQAEINRGGRDFVG